MRQYALIFICIVDGRINLNTHQSYESEIEARKACEDIVESNKTHGDPTYAVIYDCVSHLCIQSGLIVKSPTVKWGSY